ERPSKCHVKLKVLHDVGIAPQLQVGNLPRGERGSLSALAIGWLDWCPQRLKALHAIPPKLSKLCARCRGQERHEARDHLDLKGWHHKAAPSARKLAGPLLQFLFRRAASQLEWRLQSRVETVSLRLRDPSWRLLASKQRMLREGHVLLSIGVIAQHRCAAAPQKCVP